MSKVIYWYKPGPARQATSFLQGASTVSYILRYNCLLRRRSLVETGPSCLPFFRVGQGGVLEKQEAAAEEAGGTMKKYKAKSFL